MAATNTTRKAPRKRQATSKPTVKSTVKSAGKPAGKPARMSLAEVMRALEQAGSEKTKKVYARHGAREPMFGVQFGTLKTLVDRIGIDHEFARELWATGNQDARNLAMKIADPARISGADLDRWAKENTLGMCGAYIGSLAAESPHGAGKARTWLASGDAGLRASGWTVVAQMASLDANAPDDWFEKHLVQIEKAIRTAPSVERGAMNAALIAIGGRSAALRKAAIAAAKRIGPVEVDHGDTACKTPDAVTYITKMWERSTKFDSPAAAERARESMRTRC